jgi:uncharacterized protein YndB with AHSA1/START domain
MDGTLLRDGERCVLRFERRLAHPVERVWRAVTEPSELAHWFPGEVEIDLAVGGKITFAEQEFEGDLELLPTHGTVTELDPPRLFAFTWGDDPLRFELTPDGDGCVLVFTHGFENRAGATRFAAGWDVCLDALEAALAGTQASGAGWAEYHERYADELGSDGTFTRDGGSAVFRFERVLDRPIEDVWAALTEPERLRQWLVEAGADFEATEGGRVELRFGGTPDTIGTGAVTRVDPPKVLEYTSTGPDDPDGVLKWQLIPAGDRCLLLFTHTVHGDVNAAGTLAAWHVHLALLATSLAGEPTWPLPEERCKELKAMYGALARRG